MGIARACQNQNQCRPFHMWDFYSWSHTSIARCFIDIPSSFVFHAEKQVSVSSSIYMYGWNKGSNQWRNRRSQHNSRLNSRDSYKFHSISLTALRRRRRLFNQEKSEKVKERDFDEITKSRDKNWSVFDSWADEKTRKVIDLRAEGREVKSFCVATKMEANILNENPWKLSNFIVSFRKKIPHSQSWSCKKERYFVMWKRHDKHCREKS